MRVSFLTVISIVFLLLLGGCAPPDSAPGQGEAKTAPATGFPLRTLQPQPGETHFSELRMLTDGGENAEAYFSFAGDRLIFQTTREPFDCDQIYTMNIDGSDPRLVSTGKGRTTCAYFLPGDEKILYSSTHLADEACPPPPDMSQGYAWATYPAYDIFVANADGSGLERLTNTPGYDAEATISPRGDRIVFTSKRSGDLEIYTMNLDGSDVRQLTDEFGYDGGPFFSPDGARIVYRSFHPETDEEIARYESLSDRDLVSPGKLEIWVMDADGSNKRRVTDLGVASFGPFFHPSGEKIIFSSNYEGQGREFELWMIGVDGSGLERITHSEAFDGFPMFAPNGTTFVFASNRENSAEGDTNVFVTEWKD